MPKLTLTLLVLIALLGLAFTEARAAESNDFPVCGMIVGMKRKGEVVARGTYDKFRHCALSCVITRACGAEDSLEIGLLKELYDAMGFGDPSADDLRADLAGTQIGIARDVTSREDCYRECDQVYPKNLRPRETNSGVPGA